MSVQGYNARAHQCRARENALVDAVKALMAAGFPQANDDLVVDALVALIERDAAIVKIALIDRFGEDDGLGRYADLIAGALDGERAEAVARTLSDWRRTSDAERAVRYTRVVEEATRTLLARPLTVDAGRSATEADTVERICRDLCRYHAAVASKPAVTPLLTPSGLWGSREWDHFGTHVARAVATEEALDAIRKLGRPVVGYGNGPGHWEQLLRQCWLEAVALNPEPVSERWGEPTLVAPPAVTALYPDHTLLLVSPSDEPLAHAAVGSFSGEFVVHAGEGWDAKEPCPPFLEGLERDFEEVDDVELPSFQRRSAWLTVYRRRRGAS